MLINEALVGQGHDQDKLMQPLGQLFVRAGLLAIGKSQKDNGEELDYKGIQSLFLQGVRSIAGSPVTYQPWALTGSAVVHDDVEKPTGDKPSEATTTGDHSNPVWIAQRAAVLEANSVRSPL